MLPRGLELHAAVRCPVGIPTAFAIHVQVNVLSLPELRQRMIQEVKRRHTELDVLGLGDLEALVKRQVGDKERWTSNSRPD